MRRTLPIIGLFTLALLLAMSLVPSQAQEPKPLAEKAAEGPDSNYDLAAEPKMLFQLESGLGIAGVASGGRSAVFTDHLLARFNKEPDYLPKAGEALSNDLETTWAEVTNEGKKGIDQGPLRGGYIYWRVDAPQDARVMLRARGHDYVLINGVPRGGDVYNTGRTILPIQLKQGDNHLFFKAGRGRLQAEIWQRPADLFVAEQDMTLPDIYIPETLGDAPMAERPRALMAGVIVVNAQDVDAGEFSIRAEVLNGEAGSEFFHFDADDVPYNSLIADSFERHIHPLGVLKIRIDLPSFLSTFATTKKLSEQPEATKIKGSLTLNYKGRPTKVTEFSLRIRRGSQAYRKTFVSRQDYSCQYYAVKPAIGATKGVALSLHGAGVEATGQAQYYSAKPNLDIVCPTNRRPFGFDWEEWGRRDAMEVLDRHLASLGINSKSLPDGFNTYLTGHSMGGHGTWQVAVQNPGRFAAIAPSAGWSQFSNYGGGPAYAAENPATAMLLKAANPSRTIDLLPNLLKTGIFVLHGDADDNVPVSEARMMRAELAKIGHEDVHWFEAKGKGHWYDLDDEPGVACLDYGPIFELFGRRKLIAPEDLREIDFRTYCPSVASKMHWIEIMQQTKQLALSTIKASRKIHKREFTITTSNVESFGIDQVAVLGMAALKRGDDDFVVTLSIDDQDFSLGSWDLVETYMQHWSKPDGISGGFRSALRPMLSLRFTKVDGKWQFAKPLQGKTPEFSGLFADAFQATTLVYGTEGSAQENLQNFAKARFDSERFLYRGNGLLRVIPDTSEATDERNLVLYGNADTNSLWPKDSEVDVRRGAIRIGTKELKGDNLAMLAIQRVGSNRVGLVATTGPAAQHVVNHLRYFLAGTGFPDWVIYSDAMLSKGSEGVIGAGFFDNQWKYDAAQSGFAEDKAEEIEKKETPDEGEKEED